MGHNAWPEARLGKLITLEYGSSLRDAQRAGIGYPVFGSNGQVGRHSNYLVAEPGIVVGRKGSVGAVNWSDGPFWPIDTTYYVRTVEDCDLRWCFWLLQSLEIGRLDSSTGVPGLNRNDAYRMRVKKPPRIEQVAIAHVLDAADEYIVKTEALIAKLKVIKQGLLHDLLTRGLDDNGELRDPKRHPEQFQVSSVGRVPACWKITTMAKEGEVVLGRQRSPKYQSGMYTTPYLRVANVFDGWIDYSDILTMDFTAEEKKTFWLQPGDILLNEGQSLELVGRCAVFTGASDTYCFQNTLIRFRAYEPNKPWFFRALFKRCLDTGRFARIARQTTSVAHLGADRLAKMAIAIPMADEQDAIANRLAVLDHRIFAESSSLLKLRNVKKGLMQDLLTGRMRVPEQMLVKGIKGV